MLKNQKKEIEVEKDGKKRIQVVIKNVRGTEEEKEMTAGKEGIEMVKVIEVGTGEKRRVGRTEIGNEGEIKKQIEKEREKDMKGVKKETPVGKGGKRGNVRTGIEGKKGQSTGTETRKEKDGKTETNWIKKIKILTNMKDGEARGMTRKIEIQIEGRNVQKMR